MHVSVQICFTCRYFQDLGGRTIRVSYATERQGGGGGGGFRGNSNFGGGYWDVVSVDVGFVLCGQYDPYFVMLLLLVVFLLVMQQIWTSCFGFSSLIYNCLVKTILSLLFLPFVLLVALSSCIEWTIEDRMRWPFFLPCCGSLPQVMLYHLYH